MTRVTMVTLLFLAAVSVAGASHLSLEAMSQGEIRKIDKDAGKLTIKHGEIKNLDMPPMTMVFRVKEPAMLERLKPGDKIRFSADKIDGVYTVVEVEPAN